MLHHRLDTKATTLVWQSEIAHTNPQTSEQTDIFKATLHHRSHCLFILQFGYLVVIFNDILHMSFLAGTHVFKAFPAYTTTEL